MTPTGWLYLDRSGHKHLTQNWGGEKVGHKPGSVLSTASSFRGQLSIWDACYQTPQAVPKNGTGKKPTIVPPTLLPTGVYLASTSRCCWCALTAPLHPYPLTLCDFRYSIFDAISNLKSGGGIFLWHYPHDRSHWALPSKFGFSGARTFLRPAFANPQPPAPTFSPNLLYAIVRQSLWDFRFTILTCRALNFDICVYSNSCAETREARPTIKFQCKSA